MKRLMAVVLATVGGIIAFRCLPADLRSRLTTRVKIRMSKGFEHMMAGLPEDAPPKLIMTVLPKLQAQHDQIIAMLQEQDALLREREGTAH